MISTDDWICCIFKPKYVVNPAIAVPLARVLRVIEPCLRVCSCPIDMDSSSRGQGNFTPSGPDQQLPGSLFRGHSPLSNSSQGGGSLRDANSTKEENTAVDPLLDGEQQHNAGPDNVGQDNWPTSYQQPKEKARESYHNSSTGGKGSGEEAVSFLSRPFERLDQLGLLTQFEQDAKETAEFEKGATSILS